MARRSGVPLLSHASRSRSKRRARRTLSGVDRPCRAFFASRLSLARPRRRLEAREPKRAPIAVKHRHVVVGDGQRREFRAARERVFECLFHREGQFTRRRVRSLANQERQRNDANRHRLATRSLIAVCGIAADMARQDPTITEEAAVTGRAEADERIEAASLVLQGAVRSSRLCTRRR